jgi:hypothetical protein
VLVASAERLIKIGKLTAEGAESTESAEERKFSERIGVWMKGEVGEEETKAGEARGRRVLTL